MKKAIMLMLVLAVVLNAADSFIDLFGGNAIALSSDKTRAFVPGVYQSQKVMQVVDLQSRSVQQIVPMYIPQNATSICVSRDLVALPDYFGVHILDQTNFLARRWSQAGTSGWNDCAFNLSGDSLYVVAYGHAYGAPNYQNIVIVDPVTGATKKILEVEEGGVFSIARHPAKDKFYAFSGKSQPNGQMSGILVVIEGDQITKKVALPGYYYSDLKHPYRIFFNAERNFAYIPWASGLIVVDERTDELVEHVLLYKSLNSMALASQTFGYAACSTWVANCSSLFEMNFASNELKTVDVQTGLASPQIYDLALLPLDNSRDLLLALAVDGTSTKLAFVERERPIIQGPVVTNGASFLIRPVASGELATIFGTGLSTGAYQATVLPLPTNLGGTMVLVNGVACPLLYASPTQVNFQVPYGLNGADLTVEIVPDSQKPGEKISISVQKARTDLGIFQSAETGTFRAIVKKNADWSTVSASNPARPGEWIVLFVTGLGEVTPEVRTGYAAPASPLSRAQAIVQAFLDGTEVPVGFAGLTPGFAGLGQINIQIPAGTSAGIHALKVWGAGTGQTIFVPVGTAQ